jgi:hypothetical protein
MTIALARGLTATSSDVIRLNHPAKSLTFRNYSKQHMFIVFSCYILVFLETSGTQVVLYLSLKLLGTNYTTKNFPYFGITLRKTVNKKSKRGT